MATGVRTRKPAATRAKRVPAAPPLTVPGYAHFGGKHHETGHVRNILDHLGVTSPHTGKPYSEEMLLGIGGGVGCGYLLFEVGGATCLLVGGRHLWQSTKAEFIQGICGRIGGRLTTKEAGSQRDADENLHEALERGRAAVVWVGQAGLPYHCLPIEWLKGFVYCIVVYGFDAAGGVYLVGDRSRSPFTVTARDLAVARPAIISLKSRTLLIDPPSRPPDLAKAVKDGIQACLNGMTKPPGATFGLSALTRWADLLTNAKDPKGWPRAVPAGRPLLEALSRIYQGIETDGTGGGAFRGMYADFLIEAAEVAGRPAFLEVAKLYREAAAAWSGLAAAALPDSVTLLKETRMLLARKNRLFEEKGPGAIPEMTTIEERLGAMRAAAAKEFPLTPGDALDLQAGLAKRLEEIHRQESAAIEALRAAAL
jgi:hypothetical protein